MNNEKFNLLLEFHQGLIRISIKQKTIDNAKSINGINDENGCKGSPRQKAKQLIASLEAREKSLKKWLTASDKKKRELYSLGHSKAPSVDVFKATFKTVYDKSSISDASKSFSVNYQTIKSLKPRIERWDEYALKYSKLL